MIAGGASLAPRRWSLAADAVAARSSPWCVSTACMTAAQRNRKRRCSSGRVARVEEVLARVGPDRPVVVLARPVEAGERLLVQEADEPVAGGRRPRAPHRELLVVGADVRALEDRRDLVLAGRDLVVARLDRHAEGGELELGLEHAREHALGDRAEVVVVEPWPFGGGAPNRVRPVASRSGRGDESAVERKYSCSTPTVAVTRALASSPKSRTAARTAVSRARPSSAAAGSCVQRLARPRRERGRDAQHRAGRAAQDEGGRGRVPRCSRGPRTSPARRRWGTRTRRARP